MRCRFLSRDRRRLGDRARRRRSGVILIYLDSGFSSRVFSVWSAFNGLAGFEDLKRGSVGEKEIFHIFDFFLFLLISNVYSHRADFFAMN